MHIGIIVQVRMSSQRLPGKALYPVAGKPMLQYLLERLERCEGIATVVVATSTDESDTPIAEFCHRHSVVCYRGPLLDVAGRFKEVLEKYSFDSIVRVNGDSPLLDHRLIERGLQIFYQGNFDLVTNVLSRTFPKGQSIEIIRGSTFRIVYPLLQSDEELEHVTKYFYQHQDNFSIGNFISPQNFSAIQLSIDTQEDMANFASMVAIMNRPHWEYTWEDVLSLYAQVTNPAQKVMA